MGRLIEDLNKYGRTDFETHNFIIKEYEVGRWGNIGKKPANVIDYPGLYRDEVETGADASTPSDFDMDDYMNKRF